MHRRQFLTGTATLATAFVAGCAGGGGDGGGDSAVKQTSDVTMENSQFQPRNIAVDAGTTVTWTNEDSTSHTVTSASDNWSKDVEVAGGKTATHAFEESGVYDVYCRFHGSPDLSGMSMKIAVGGATIQRPLGDDGDGGSGAYG